MAPEIIIFISILYGEENAHVHFLIRLFVYQQKDF